MSDQYQIITPENVELNYEIAGIGSRFLAIAIDTVIQMIFILAIFMVLAWFGSKTPNVAIKPQHFSSSLIMGILIVFVLLLNFGYFIILEIIMNGQTIGKKLLNIRVRKDLGGAPTFWDVLLRNFIRLVDMLPSFYGIGIIIMFMNKKAKRLGDYAAGTIVVKELPRKKVQRFLNEEFAVLPAESLNITLPTQDNWLKSLLPVLNQNDYLLLKNLLSRQQELSNFNSLALQILKQIYSRVSQEKLPIKSDLNLYELTQLLKELVSLYEEMFQV